MHHFCTYFDRNYLTRGLALYESLRRHCGSFQLWILPLDPDSEALIRKLELPSVRVVGLSELEAAVPGLSAARSNRNTLEFYFTCSPSLPGYVLASDPSVDRITYLDADLWFFADPEAVFDEIGDAPVAIVEHRFSPANVHLEKGSGRFNVSWVTFRRVPEAAACLARWQAQCLEWCHDRAEEGKNADQKYLDEWPALYPGLRVISTAGAGIAPWNVASVELSETAGTVKVQGSPLYFFHFHGLRKVGRRIYDPVLLHFFTEPTPVLKDHVYGPYVCTLEAILSLLGEKGPSLQVLGHLKWSRSQRPEQPVFTRLLNFLRAVRRVIQGEYFHYPRIDRNSAVLAKDLSIRLGMK